MTDISLPVDFLVMRYASSCEVFSIGEGVFHISSSEKLGTLVTVGFDGTEPVELLDENTIFNPRPHAEATAHGIRLDETHLRGLKFSIPKSYDDEMGDHATRFYYLSHEDADNNEIQVIDAEAGRVRFRWTGKTLSLIHI